MNASNNVGAFFDLDGTLLPAPSLEWRFIGYLLAGDDIGAAAAGRWLAQFALNVLRSPRTAIEANKIYLAGLRESLATDWAITLNSDCLPFFASGIERICWHLAQEHRIFIVSGTLEPLALAAAQHLPARVGVSATKLEVQDGNWTGRLAGEHVNGKAKARAVQALSNEHNIDLYRSFAYGNRIADLAMLEAVGHPIAINPSSRLERVAQARGWQILNWRKVQTNPLTANRRVLSPLSPKGAQ
jgi:HAD superfamily hydrolase (TIGR01490 family)